MPPDKRPQELIDALDSLLKKPALPEEIAKEIEEEADRIMMLYAGEGLLEEKAVESATQETQSSVKTMQ